MIEFCIDVDECSESISPLAICPRGSRCINTNGSYTCTCNAGYFHFQIEIGNMNRCEGKLIGNTQLYYNIIAISYDVAALFN